MRIYLAGPSAEIERVKEAAAVLHARGHDVIGRWWLAVEAARRDGYASDADLPLGRRVEAVRGNAAAIRDADVVIALTNTGGGMSTGVAWEVGFAEGIGTNVVMVGDTRHVCGSDLLRADSVIEAINIAERP